MRLAMIAALAAVAVVGCSAGGDCFPSTCPDGCCGADGLCHAGTEANACGSRANTCVDCGAAGQFCGTDQFCHAPVNGPPTDGGMDAGFDAGTDAGPNVFVTLRYHYAINATNCPPAPPSSEYECIVARPMPKAQFDAIRLDYLECETTQPTSDGYDIDCGGCVSKSETCVWDKSDGGTSLVTRGYYECPEPAHTTPGACEWNP